MVLAPFLGVAVPAAWQAIAQLIDPSFLAKAFLTLFVVIDPIGLIPLFITLARGRTEEEQAHIARRAVLFSAGILLAFSFSGAFLLRYLDISMEAFQTTAGILLFKIGIDMVFAHRERETKEEEQEAQIREDISVFPLAIPLIAGPGTLASLLILINEGKDYSLGTEIVLADAAIVLLIAYGLLLLANVLAKQLGQTGVNVVTRLFGVLLAALAVQYIADGAIALLKTGLLDVLHTA
ncbi:MAG: MarC family protein [Myxacorys chilensis ATA2-1-KO14]|jgi:multiple antibiotic resistance protein|nr:MarC family protein [Myxacorys chilensis ATA2-1-KO14]